MGWYADVIAKLSEPTLSLRNASPGVWAGFVQLHKAAVAAGALPVKVKEPMALGVPLLMDGGTASVYGPRAWDAYREFAAATPTRQPAPSDEPARDVA
jgi:hypothetical protein